MAPFFARITFSFELSTPKLIFPPSFVNFPSGGPFPPSLPGLYGEIVKHFAEGQLKEAGAIQKDLQLHNVNIVSYYTNKYALWLDFRTIDDNRLHGSGRRLENTSEGIRLQITKESGSAGKLPCYLYIFQDAQINISDAQFLNIVY